MREVVRMGRRKGVRANKDRVSMRRCDLFILREQRYASAFRPESLIGRC